MRKCSQRDPDTITPDQLASPCLEWLHICAQAFYILHCKFLRMMAMRGTQDLFCVSKSVCKGLCRQDRNSLKAGEKTPCHTAMIPCEHMTKPSKLPQYNQVPERMKLVSI